MALFPKTRHADRVVGVDGDLKMDEGLKVGSQSCILMSHQNKLSSLDVSLSSIED